MVVDRTYELDWRVLKTVKVNEETLVEVNLAPHLLLIVLVQKSYVSTQVGCVINPMKAFTRTQHAVRWATTCVVLRFADALIA